MKKSNKKSLKARKEKEHRIKTHELIRTVAVSITLVIQVMTMLHLYGLM